MRFIPNFSNTRPVITEINNTTQNPMTTEITALLVSICTHSPGNFSSPQTIQGLSPAYTGKLKDKNSDKKKRMLNAFFNIDDS